MAEVGPSVQQQLLNMAAESPSAVQKGLKKLTKEEIQEKYELYQFLVEHQEEIQQAIEASANLV
jgi:hypothetical protein